MIVRDAAAFRAALESRALPADRAPTPRGVFLVLPEDFRVDPESAVDNPYMDLDGAVDPARALAQARELARAIERAGVPVTTFPGDADAPDGVFPNNVFATVPGRLVIGSMRHAGRRREAHRADIRAHFRGQGYAETDLSQRDCVAELTGPLVIDRARGIGFCGLGPRVDEAGLAAMHEALDLRLSYAFPLAEGEYHLNVVMTILAARACLLHPGAFVEQGTPPAIAAAFPGRCLFLDEAEKNAFAANSIALTERDLFLSRRAADGLRPDHRAALEGWGFELHAVELDEIEKAGGSLRCMVAEIF